MAGEEKYAIGEYKGKSLSEMSPVERIRAWSRVHLWGLLHPTDTDLWKAPERSKAEKLADLINKEIAAVPDLPQEQQDVLDIAPALLMMLASVSGGTAIGMLLSSFMSPVLAPLSYSANKAVKPYRFDVGTIIRLALRKWEDKPDGKEFWADLVDQGWDEDRLNAAKELMKIIPPLADMVRFADFSAFDEEVIEKWREFYDAPDWIKEPFSLLGVTDEWANKYWFSHWIQPGRFELGELHRRGKVSDDDVKLAYRTMGYSPYWQDHLLELVKAVPTRVDVRRWWDMRTINEERLREIYHAQGFYGQDLEDYVLWTKVYVAFPDLIARAKYGWISPDTIVNELVALGMPEDRAKEMYETKFKKVVMPERVQAERELTKTDITMAVKKEVITREQGIDLLIDLGYDIAEAGYIIDARVAAAGSPESYLEYKQLVNEYRKALGEEVKQIPSEVLEAGKLLAQLERKLLELTRSEAPQEDINQLQADIEIAKAKYQDLTALAGL